MNWKEFWKKVKKMYITQNAVITHDIFYDRVMELRTRPEEEYDEEDLPCTFCEWFEK